MGLFNCREGRTFFIVALIAETLWELSVKHMKKIPVSAASEPIKHFSTNVTGPSAPAAYVQRSSSTACSGVGGCAAFSIFLKKNVHPSLSLVQSWDQAPQLFGTAHASLHGVRWYSQWGCCLGLIQCESESVWCCCFYLHALFYEIVDPPPPLPGGNRTVEQMKQGADASCIWAHYLTIFLMHATRLCAETHTHLHAGWN